MKFYLSKRIFLVAFLFAGFGLLFSPSILAQIGTDPSKYNVVWNTPSESSFGSMPLGNGDIGLNVWVEKNGDLLFYISKVDAFDAGHLLPKLGEYA
jgi:hypothetical protein